MPAKMKDYPLYVYDEPQTYEDFSGGINTDPSNEHLTEFEMRDCLNMTYMSGALVKRKGAKLLCDISCEEDLHNIQGVFLFTYRITYLIIAADGKLYQGFFNEHTTIHLTRLRIVKEPKENLSLYDPTDLFAGLKEYYEERTNVMHDGFIYSYLINDKGDRENYFYRGDFYDITEGNISSGEVISYNGIKYQCISSYFKEVISPETHSEYWVCLGKNLSSEYTADMKIKGPWVKETTEWFQDTIVTITKIEEEIIKTPEGDTYKETVPNIYYYKCLKRHNTYNVFPTDVEFFKKIVEHRELIFQNTRKIEAVTYNNKLYIATGTRFIEVYLLTNSLIAQPVTPYQCNNTEITKIGFNYMSPYPEYSRQTQYNTITTSISNLLAVKNIYGSYTLTPQMNFQSGESETDYIYRWEKKINGIWNVIHTFNSQAISPTDIHDNTLSRQNLFTINVDDADRF